MEDVKQLQDRMKKIMFELRECVDLSLEIRKKDKSTKKIIDSYWEDFLNYFLSYVRKREKETGEEVLKNFSFTRLLKFFNL